MIVGIVVGVFFVLRQNANGVILDARDADGTRVLRFRRDGTFISKPALVGMLDSVQSGDHVVVDGSGEFMDHDMKEVLAEFVNDAPSRGVKVQLRGIDLAGAAPGGGH